LLALVAFAGILGVTAHTSSVSGNATNAALSDSTALNVLSIAGKQSNLTCHLPLQQQMTNQTSTPPQPRTGNANGTRTPNPPPTSQTTNQTGSSPQRPPEGANQTGSVNPLPPSRTTNQTGTPRQPPPRDTNQTGTSHPEPAWMANLTAEQRQTLEETTAKMRWSGATPEQIWNVVIELLRQWGIPTPQCP
jgi:hypothetical protein